MPINLERFKARHAAILEGGEPCFKAFSLGTPEVDRKARTVSGLVSSTRIDMDDEVVVPKGFKRHYFPDAVRAVYFNHDYDSPPVGKCVNLASRGKQLFAQTYISKTAFGEDVLTMLEEGVINGFSVGFKPDEFGPPTAEEIAEHGPCGSIVRTSTLIEYSVTPMPCNPDALVSMVSKGAIHRSTAVAFGLPDSPVRKVFPVSPPRRTVVVAGGVAFVRRAT